MKRVLLSFLFLSMLSIATLSLVMAESTVTFDSSSITVRIITPENITYHSSNIQVTVTTQANPAVVNVAYSLDGGNLTYILRGNLAHTYNDTFSLNGLEEGVHRLDVQADTFAQNSNGYITAHSSVTFSITTKATPTPTPYPTITPTNYPTPSPMPTSTPTPSIIEQTPNLAPAQVGFDFITSDTALALIAIVIVILAVASISLVYFRRRRAIHEEK